MKKFLSVILSALLSFTMLFSTACDNNAQAVTPKLRINETTNEWEISYDNEQTWTSLGVKATGEQGAQGEQGVQGTTPKLRINETTNEWEISYDNEQTWTSLGVSASGGNGGTGGGDENAYTPVVRFAVASDVHIRRYDTYDGVDQLEKLYSTAYRFTNNDERNSGYNKLDGIFMVGDLTNYESYAYEYDLYFDCVEENTRGTTLSRAVMGNHEFSQIVYSYTDGWNNPEMIADATNKFLEKSGYETEDYHTEINDFHFIFVSMDKYVKSSNTGDTSYISDTKLAWLEEELDKAVADDPTGEKPIFVFQHVHPQDTVGSSTNGDRPLKALLDNYPNVVDFSGHTHKPITDPRSIWQGTFTALNTGSMAYLSHTLRDVDFVKGGVNAVNENGEWSTATEAEGAERDGGLYYLCEVDANNVMRVFIYDTFTDSVFGEPMIIDSFGDPTGFVYKSYRETDSVAPEFADTDEITVLSNAFNRTDISFPQATGDDLVESYRIEVYKGSALVKTEYRLSGCQYGNAMPENMKVTLSGLETQTEYTVKVYAINYWSKVSEPLVKTFTTANTATTVTPDIMSVTFNENGGVDLLGSSVTKVGSVSTSLDTGLNSYVGVFNNNGAYTATNLKEWITTMSAGFTMEVMVKITTAPASSKYGLLSAHDYGGAGLYYTSGGNFHFTTGVTKDNTTASAEGAVGEWTHVVGVYDTENIKLYLNGELVATTAFSSFMPPRLSANHAVIGADPYYINTGSNNMLEYKSKSNISMASMYGYALTAEQVLARYQSL